MVMHMTHIGDQEAIEFIHVPTLLPHDSHCKKRVRLIFLILAFVFSLSVVKAKDPSFAGQRSTENLKQSGFIPLFDGTSFAGWNYLPEHKGHWVAVDREIHYDGKATNKKRTDKDLWTKKNYGDYELYVEWRLPVEPHLKPHPIVLYNGDFLMEEKNPRKRVTRLRLDAGDSGLYFRGSTKCQANVWSQELGSGEINGYRTDKKMPSLVRRSCIPFKKADRPLGKWNAFLITFNGSSMTVVLNGEKVLHAPHLPDLPKSGPIALQHHNDPVEFRKIWIKELNH